MKTSDLLILAGAAGLVWLMLGMRSSNTTARAVNVSAKLPYATQSPHVGPSGGYLDQKTGTEYF